MLAAGLFVAACGDDAALVDAGTDAGSAGDGAPALDSAVDGGPTIPVGEVFETLGRLSVADRDSATVAVWDLDVEAEVTRYALSAPAELHGALSRQIPAVVAAQPAAGRFDVFGVGVWVWDHVDHFHVYKEPSAIQVDPMLAMTDGLTGVNVSGGWIVAFDQTTGRVSALFERSIGNLRTDVDRTRAPVFRTYETPPHEGAAVVSRGHLFVSRAEGGLDMLPPGFDAHTTLDLPCAPPVRAAAVELHAVFACRDSLLLSTWDEVREEFDFAELDAGEAGAAISGWAADDDAPAFVGRRGATRLVFVSRESGEVSTADLGEPVRAIALERDARWLLALTEDGELLDLDPATGAERRRAAVMDGPGPLAVGDAHAYVGEPDAERVHVIDLETMTVTGALEIGLTPASLVVTALWPGGEPVAH